MQKSYFPEGTLFDSEENQRFISSKQNLLEAFENDVILEAKATMFDKNKNTVVKLGEIKGIIPFSECSYYSIKEIGIISKVGKPICFKIKEIIENNSDTVAILSRKSAQSDCYENYISQLRCGDIIDGKIMHIEQFGCFVDIGCGITSLLPIDNISVSRISSPFDRFCTSQNIKCVVRAFDDEGRVVLSHKELLGTWMENASRFAAGETVTGIVRSIEDYGIFVELAPNLAGLAESCSGVKVGMTASVYIKSIIPERMKIKLIIIDAFETTDPPTPINYFNTQSHIDSFRYSPECCSRVVETVF